MPSSKGSAPQPDRRAVCHAPDKNPCESSCVPPLARAGGGVLCLGDIFFKSYYRYGKFFKSIIGYFSAGYAPSGRGRQTAEAPCPSKKNLLQKTGRGLKTRCPGGRCFTPAIAAGHPPRTVRPAGAFAIEAPQGSPPRSRSQIAPCTAWKSRRGLPAPRSRVPSKGAIPPPQCTRGPFIADIGQRRYVAPPIPHRQGPGSLGTHVLQRVGHDAPPDPACRGKSLISLKCTWKNPVAENRTGGFDVVQSLCHTKMGRGP